MTITQGATGAAQVAIAGESVAFAAGEGIDKLTTITVRNRIAATGNLVVRIPELHGASGGATLLPGDKEPFRVKDGEISQVLVSGINTIVDWWGTAVTRG